MVSTSQNGPAAVWPGLRTAAPALSAAILGAVVLLAPQTLNDGDTYWHVATGRWILEHGRIPRVDVFSYTRPGAPWFTHEWLAEVLMALAWRSAGWAGVAGLFAAAAAAAAWMIVARVGRAVGGITLLLTAVLAFSCMAGSLLARPHLLALLLLVVWTGELLDAREADRPPRLAFALLMTVWVNLHASYVLGFILAGAFGLEALTAPGARRLEVVRGWGLFGALSLLAALVTPLGVEVLLYPFQVTSMSTLYGIAEWRQADFSHPTVFEAALLVTLFVTLSRGVRVPPVRLLLLLGLLHLALQHMRHQLVLAAVAPLLFAGPLGSALGHPPSAGRRPRAIFGGFAVIVLALVCVRAAIPLARHDGKTTPAAALAHVPPALRREPVFNTYGFGGFLIFQGVRPFIDGRADMYGDAFDDAYFSLNGADAATLDRTLDRYGVTWTLLAPDDPNAATLDHDPRWRRLYADAEAVVHVRDGAAPPLRPSQR